MKSHEMQQKQLRVDWLKSTLLENGDVVYDLDKARERYEVQELSPNGWLVLNWGPDDRWWLKFAVLAFSRSDIDGANVLASCVFHGEGPSGNQRECRHTWWGEDGYVFYPDGKLISAAFIALSEFFDY